MGQWRPRTEHSITRPSRAGKPQHGAASHIGHCISRSSAVYKGYITTYKLHVVAPVFLNGDVVAVVVGRRTVGEVPVYEASPWLCPDGEELRFLPEGPRVDRTGRVTWVAIQHGATSSIGSLNIVRVAPSLQPADCRCYRLKARPGFAFPTTESDLFLVGLERQLVLYDAATDSYQPISSQVEQDVEGTIINDAEMFSQGLVFGAKDLQFKEAKAGLYLFRSSDGALIRLRSDQVCSNGKVLKQRADGSWTLWDIDTPRRQVIRYRLDVERGTLDEESVAIDLTDDPAYPDGMVATPDGCSAIIAFYHPGAVAWGEARQYSLETGTCQAIWRVPGSPQVTCPQLLCHQGRVYLLLTTAVEHMPAERRPDAPFAGCLFLAPTAWTAPLAIKLWDPVGRCATFVDYPSVHP